MSRNISRPGKGPSGISGLRLLRRASLAGMLGVAVIGACLSPVMAADDDDDEFFDQKIIKNVMRGMGLRNGQETTIEYHERSPLVVPPSRALPPPEAAAGAKSASWPKDQDIERKKQAKAAAKPKPGTDAASSWEAARNPISRAELDKGKLDQPSKLDPSAHTRPSIEGAGQLKPWELGYKGDLFTNMFSSATSKEEQVKFDKEPERATLTDPPPGYRTPSAAQPYGLSKEASKNKPIDIYDRATGGDPGKR